jgi:hypothetical protein
MEANSYQEMVMQWVQMIPIRKMVLRNQQLGEQRFQQIQAWDWLLLLALFPSETRSVLRIMAPCLELQLASQ